MCPRIQFWLSGGGNKTLYPDHPTINITLSTQRLFLDHPRTYSSSGYKTNLQSKRSASTLRITRSDQCLHIRLESIDVSQTLSDTLCDLGSGIATTECCRETIAECLVGKGGRNRDTKHGPQTAEEVGASGGNGLVVARCVGNETDQSGSNTDACLMLVKKKEGRTGG